MLLIIIKISGIFQYLKILIYYIFILTVEIHSVLINIKKYFLIMSTQDSSQMSTREYNLFGSVLRPFTAKIYDESGNVSGTFKQEVDTRTVIDYTKIIKEQLEEAQIEALKENEKHAAVVEMHAEKQKAWDPVITEPENNDPQEPTEMTTEEKEALLAKIKAAKLLGKTHSTLDRQEVEAVTAHIGEPVDETNAIFEDGVIDQKDVECVRIAIRYQYEKAGTLIDDSNPSANIEDLVKFTIRPTSGQAIVTINGTEAPNKAIATYPGTTVSYHILSCGKYEASGTYTVTEQKILTIEVKEDVTSSTFTSACNRSYGGNILVTENITAGAVTSTVAASGTYTLDMDDHSYTSTDSIRPGFYIRGNSIWTINNAGTMTAPSTEKPLVYVGAVGSVLNINSGEWISVDGSGECIYCYSGTINISGGTFKNDCEGAARYLLNCYDSNYKSGTAKMIVTGGKFYGFDPANSNDGNYVAEGYVSIQKTDDQGKTYYEVVAQ